MRWLDRIRNALAPRARKRPDAMMNRFEMSGLHDLSSSVEFRRDTASTMLVLFFGGLALFVILSLWIGTFSKQETMRGVVLGTKGGQRISATVEGTVSEVWVEQGEWVEAGQRLMTVVPQQTAAGAQALSEVHLRSLTDQHEASERRLAEIRDLMSRDAQDLDAFERSTATLIADLRQQEGDLSRALAEQEKAVDTLREYLEVGYVTRESVSLQERVYQDYRQQLAQIRFQITQVATGALERRRAVDQSNSANASELSRLAQSQTDLDSKIEYARAEIATDVLATTGGHVAALNVREGAQVVAGDTLAAIGDPDAPFLIGLQAPSKTIGLLEIGQRVVLKYDAFPFKTFGVKYGRVVSIGSQPLTLPPLGEPALQADPTRPPQSQFLVEVEPEDRTIFAYGVERPILIGSSLTADVVVERRRLIDWVIDPILAMRGRV